MDKRGLLCVALVAGLMLLVLLVACGGEQGPAPQTPATETAPTAVVSPAPPSGLGGQEMLEARCTRCHSLDRVQAAAKTLAEWEATVERMRGKGAELTDGEAQVLVQFLAETYAP